MRIQPRRKLYACYQSPLRADLVPQPFGGDTVHTWGASVLLYPFQGGQHVLPGHHLLHQLALLPAG